MIHLTYYWLAWANYLIIIKYGPPSFLPLDLYYVWFNCLKYLLIFIMHDSIAWTTFWSLSCMIDLLSFLLIFSMTRMLLYCWSLLNASLLSILLIFIKHDLTAFLLFELYHAWSNCFSFCWSSSCMIQLLSFLLISLMHDTTAFFLVDLYHAWFNCFPSCWYLSCLIQLLSFLLIFLMHDLTADLLVPNPCYLYTWPNCLISCWSLVCVILIFTFLMILIMHDTTAEQFDHLLRHAPLTN